MGILRREAFGERGKGGKGRLEGAASGILKSGGARGEHCNRGRVVRAVGRKGSITHRCKVEREDNGRMITDPVATFIR